VPPVTTAQATVFIVEDDPSMRKSVRSLVESAGLRAETFASADEYLERLNPEEPGCLILDLRMPGTTGLQLLEQLRQRKVQIPAIIVTAFGDVPSAVFAIKTGAVDFIEKPFSGAQLLERVQQAIELDAKRRKDSAANAEIRGRLSLLTAREKEVLDLVVAGLASKQIAMELHLSQKTVESHRAHIMEKLQVGNVAELVNMVMTANAGHASRDGQ
jgi:FixJ family two-component response regulator